MIPVFVCVPTQNHIIDVLESFPIQGEYLSSPIGYLRGFETVEITDNEMVEKELAKLGLAMRYRLQRVKAADGWVGCLICFAVEVPGYEQAEQLPGFVPFGKWTGSFFIPPDFPPNFDWNFHGVKRLALADCGGNKAVPNYKDDGSFYYTLSFFGRFAAIVYLKEDPEHLYTVMHTADEVKAVAAARACLAELQGRK